MLQVEHYRLGPLDNGVYLVRDPDANECVVVDPSYGSEVLLEDIRAKGLRVAWILNTHAHFDHVVMNALFARETGAPIALHPKERELLADAPLQAEWLGLPPPEPSEATRWIEGGDLIPVGERALVVLETPGHSPGGVTFLGDHFIVCGDALFAGSIGRTDLPGADHDQLLRSIREELIHLPDDTIVYPGHGPATTIGVERRTNPFL
jgi:glyoxylase-like metal-dependent hydrolase (beta-lactamase superfamily II)